MPGRRKVIFGLPYGLGQAIMIMFALCCSTAIVKEFEPLLLLPIGFGGLLANMPFANVTAPPVVDAVTKLVIEPAGSSLLFEFGVNTGLFPIIIFMGVVR